MLHFLLIALLLLFTGAAFSYFTPHDPLHVNMKERILPANSEHWLGTDHLGRDIFSRIAAGAKTTVGTGMLILAAALMIGVPAGLVSGYIGGLFDRIFMRVVDAFMAFPDYIVAIILSGLLGPGLMNLIFAIVMVKWVGYARLVRGTVLSLKQKDYVLLARINGLSSVRILWKHILPHVAGHVLVLATLDLGKVILMIAALSYIGLGAQPPAPEWGAMLNDGKAFFYHSPELMIIPGLCIMLVVLLSNVAGDRLRDKYDVKNAKGGLQ
ncbi:nickel transporter permease [Fictibacillus iocasae]|uniref:Nickel transporter permease n=1 Tax=Fictibacillus iocasae TaxID=2715437 RepID=A0ABW2NVC8_9BACL